MSRALRVLAAIPGVDAALAFVREAYEARLRRPGRTVEHPIAVGALLAAEGQDAEVVVAGLLHDVLEDTDVVERDLHVRFGADVASLVVALTQDPAVEDYRERKAALRAQVLAAGPRVATITLADKIAKLEGARRRPRKRRLAHYRATLDGVEARYGRGPLSERLRTLLSEW